MRIVMIGGGKLVYFLTRQLTGRSHHVTVINRSESEGRDLARHTDAIVVRGDGSDPDILAEAGARRADILLALTPHDEDNLIACQTGSKLYGVPRTLALVNDPENEEVFRKLGVGAVFSATQIIASLIEQRADFEDIVKLMPLAEGGISITELKLDQDSPAIGRSVKDLRLSPGTLIAAIIRNGNASVASGSSVLLSGDLVILVSQPEYYDEDLIKLTGDTP